MLKYKQALTVTNNMDSSVLWEYVILSNINAHHRWHHWLYEEKHLVPTCIAPNSDAAGHHTYQLLRL